MLFGLVQLLLQLPCFNSLFLNLLSHIAVCLLGGLLLFFLLTFILAPTFFLPTSVHHFLCFALEGLQFSMQCPDLA